MLKNAVMTMFFIAAVGAGALVCFEPYAKSTWWVAWGVTVSLLAIMVLFNGSDKNKVKAKLIKNIQSNVELLVGLGNTGVGFNIGEVVLWRPARGEYMQFTVEAANWSYGMLALRPVGGSISDRLVTKPMVVPIWEVKRAN